jgi:hypothetical protein
MRQAVAHPAVLLLLCAFAAAACGGRDEGDEVYTRTTTVQETTYTEWRDSAEDDVVPGLNRLPGDDFPPPADAELPVAPEDSPAQANEPADGGRCDPNYTPCVPIASDVDCAGGRGNGPAYVQGPVRVIGRDIYKLDRDGDGIGCEN